jgi:antitoxin YefM
MYTLYKINADELNEKFIASIKAQFQHKDIEIAICETTQSEQDETGYLLRHPANKARLLEAIDNIKKGEWVTVDLDDPS